MRRNWRRVLPWAAFAALALLALGVVPHLHDEVDGHAEHCVLCHAQDAPSIASDLPANPDPVAHSADVPVAAVHVHGMTPTGGGSRAPPA